MMSFTDPSSTVGSAVVGTDTVVAGIQPVHYAGGDAMINGEVVAVPPQTVYLPVGASSTIVMPSGEIIVEFGTVADQPGQIVLDSFTVLDPSSSVVGSAVVGTAPVVGIIGWWSRGTLGAVAQVNIQNEAVGNTQLQPGAVGTVALSNGAVTTPILANAAVVAANIASQAVTNAAIAAQAVGLGQLVGASGAGSGASLVDSSSNTLLHGVMSSGVQGGISSSSDLIGIGAARTNVTSPSGATGNTGLSVVIPGDGTETWSVFVQFTGTVSQVAGTTVQIEQAVTAGSVSPFAGPISVIGNLTAGTVTTPFSQVYAGAAAGNQSITLEFQFSTTAGPGGSSYSGSYYVQVVRQS
jgi:hypothetical protein